MNDLRPATEKQKHLLDKFGVPYAHDVLLRAASNMIHAAIYTDRKIKRKRQMDKATYPEACSAEKDPRVNFLEARRANRTVRVRPEGGSWMPVGYMNDDMIRFVQEDFETLFEIEAPQLRLTFFSRQICSAEHGNSGNRTWIQFADIGNEFLKIRQFVGKPVQITIEEIR